MFDNIGCKIKALVKTVFAIEIILFIAIGIALSRTPIGFIVAIAGIFIAWVSSFALYGYGELIDNSKTQIQQNKTIITLLESHIGDNECGGASTSLNSCIKEADSKGFEPMSIASNEMEK